MKARGALMLVALLAGCATLKDSGQQALIDCGVPAVKAEASALFPQVETILEGGDVDWQAQLDALKARGLGALACAVARVGMALVGSASQPVAASVPVTGADRASFYLTTRGLEPVNVR